MAKNAVAWYKGMTPSMGKLAWGPEAWKHSVGTLTLPQHVSWAKPHPIGTHSYAGHLYSLAAATSHKRGLCRGCWELGSSFGCESELQVCDHLSETVYL